VSLNGNANGVVAVDWQSEEGVEGGVPMDDRNYRFGTGMDY